MSVALSPIRPHAPGPLDVAAMLDAADERGHEQPCRVYDPELWFAESPSDVEFAKALCIDCPVRALCFDGALERREPWGVWGGQLVLAGVVGLAVGFGSQTLVRDVITGIFLLLEDAVAVGDVVQLGGLSGVVEHLSIRSIKLRATDGSVHIVPFSAVTTVTNMTRDFSFAVLDVTVGYDEDTDRVADALRGLGKEVRAEPKWAPLIRDDIDVYYSTGTTPIS